MSRILITATLLFASVSVWGQAAERYVVLDGVSSLARVFNPSDNSEVAAIRTGPIPNSIVISPNGRLAFVADLASQYVSVIDLTIQAEIKRIRDIGPDQLSMSADGTKIVATHLNDESITIIDATTLSVLRTMDLNGLAGDDPTVEDLAFNNPVISGNKVYLNTSNDVVVLDLGTFAVTRLSGPDDSIFFQGAENLAITPDGKTLAALRAAGLVLFDTATNSQILTVPFSFSFSVATGPNPSDPTKMIAYVANSGSSSAVFSMVDVSPGSPAFGTIVGEIPLPPAVAQSQRTMIALNPGGNRAYINVSTANLNPNVFTIDTQAVITNPAAAILHQSTISAQARSVAIAATQNQPPATAPVVTRVNRAEIRNDHATTIDISGFGFAPGGNVRIGTLDPIAAQFVSSRRLRVTIPQNAPTQVASIIVTNPNPGQPFSLQHQSGILHDALTIAGPEDFQPDNQVLVANLGDHSLSIIKDGNVDEVTTEIPAGPRPSGLAITPDGSRAYIANLFPPASVDVFNFKTNSIEARIVLNGSPVSLPGQSKGVVFAPRLSTGKLAAYVVASRSGNLDLYAIDADPASPAFNTVVDDFPTNITTASTAPDSLVMTPDGRFAFIDELDFTDVGANLVVINLATRAVTKIPVASLGALAFQLTMDVSPDGKFLVLINKDDNFAVFDVSNPTNPVLVTTIIGAPTPNQPKVILEFPRIVGNRLFAFDIDHNVISIFNFNPAAHDFSQLANFTVPGNSALITAVADVTPDGKLIYMPLREEDSVAVLDVDKIIQHDPSALITKIGVGLTPEYALVRPKTPGNDRHGDN
jgi:DNA-binding beta-propeller fold protein YncE